MALSPLGRDWSRLLESAASSLAEDLAGIHPLPQVGDRIGHLLDHVVTWNRRVDLTAARSNEELVDLYLADALVLAAVGGLGSWVDVGSGGGAPGLVLALLQPELALTLVEPRAKRVAFLRNAASMLSAASVEILRGRCEGLAAASYTTAVSRATLPPPEWLVEGARLAETHVWVLLAQAAAPSLDGWVIDRDIHYRWPLTRVERRAVRYANSQTP